MNKSSDINSNYDQHYYTVSTFDSLLHILLYNIRLAKPPKEVGLAISSVSLSDKLHNRPIHIESSFNKKYIRLNKVSRTLFREKLYSKWNMIDRSNESTTMNSLSPLIVSHEVYSANLTSALIELEFGKEYPDSQALSGVLYSDFSILAHRAYEINSGYIKSNEIKPTSNQGRHL